MTDIVNLVHPAPVIHLVRGGRKERVAYARMVTPVEVPRVGEGEPNQVAGGGAVEAVYEHGGRYWLRPRVIAAREERRMPGLAGILDRSIPPEACFHTTLAGLLSRTPLCGWEDYAPQWGAPFSDAGLRRVVADGRDWAPEAAARFVRENVLVAGDDLLLRWDGPCAGSGTSRDIPGMHPHKDNVAFHPRAWLVRSPTEFLVRDDLLEGSGIAGLRPHWDRMSAAQAGAAAGLDPTRFGDADLVAMLNDVPRRILSVALRSVEIGNPEPEWRETLAGWGARGMVGAIAPEDAPALLPLARRACADLRALPNGDSLGFLARLEEYLDVVAVPRLAGMRPGAEPLDGPDEDALGGIAP